MTERRENMTDLPERRGSDVLSEVLRAVRLRGAVFYTVKASASWVVEAPPTQELAHIVMPGSEHVIAYHVISSGGCWTGPPGGPATRLEEGDIIIYPHGDAHIMASEPGMRGPIDIEHHEVAARKRLPVPVDTGGDGANPVHVVCGFLACDARPFNPLLNALPKVMHVKRPTGAPGDMLSYLVTTALAESSSPRAGGEVMLSRLSELMFVEIVRHYVTELDPRGSGWLSGLRDEVVGRALAALHSKPAYTWSLEELGKEAGASRSVLADRFVEHVGVPPMMYLAQWRMQLAAGLLAGPATLAEIATEVGYGSEAAFSRAFKKIVGVAPATWRSQQPRSR